MKQLVGTFSEEDLKLGLDTEAIAQAKKKSGLKYIISKRVRVGGTTHMRVWLTDNINLMD